MADVSKLMRDAEEFSQFWHGAIENTAKSLADQMKDIYGGEWRVQVDHEVGLIVVAKRLHRASEGGAA